MLTAERSDNCLCNPYFWWVGDMGNPSGLHPRWWAKEGWEVIGGQWVEEFGQSALCCWVLAPCWNQAWEKEIHKSSCPNSKDLSFCYISIYVIKTHGILPLISVKLLDKHSNSKWDMQVSKAISFISNFLILPRLTPLRRISSFRL